MAVGPGTRAVPDHDRYKHSVSGMSERSEASSRENVMVA
jgi:hypothetical protein